MREKATNDKPFEKQSTISRRAPSLPKGWHPLRILLSRATVKTNPWRFLPWKIAQVSMACPFSLFSFVLPPFSLRLFIEHRKGGKKFDISLQFRCEFYRLNIKLREVSITGKRLFDMLVLPWWNCYLDR